MALITSPKPSPMKVSSRNPKMTNYDWLVKELADSERLLAETGENWVVVDGFEDYKVSSSGRVYSMPKMMLLGNTFKRKLGSFVGFVNAPNGYLRVSLRNSAYHNKKLFTHVIVAKAFIPNPDNKPQVNHKNGNKRDNRVDNLEWVTAQENLIHSYEVLGRKPRSKYKKIQ